MQSRCASSASKAAIFWQYAGYVLIAKCLKMNEGVSGKDVGRASLSSGFKLFGLNLLWNKALSNKCKRVCPNTTFAKKNEDFSSKDVGLASLISEYRVMCDWYLEAHRREFVKIF